MPKMNPNSTVSRINSLTGAGRRIARNRNYAVGNQAGDIVVAYQQQVHGQGFAVAEQLVAAFAPTQAAGGQQRACRLGQAAAFLDGNAQTVARRGGDSRTHAGGSQWEGADGRDCWRRSAVE